MRRLASSWITVWLVLAVAAPTHAAPPASAPTPASIWTPGRLDPARGLVGPWRRELAERKQALALAAGASPRAILPLLGSFGSLQGELPNAELAAFFDEVRHDRRRHPIVRAHASWLRGRVHEADGEFDRAHALFGEAGFMSNWLIVGPFDNSNRSGHQAIYAPEHEPFEARQSFSGKLPLEALSWREHDEATASRALVSFDELLRPNTQACGYATTWIESSRARPAALHLGTGGPYKVWLDGHLVGERDVIRAPHPLQESHALSLRKGVNRLLVKLCVEDGVWGFHARLSDTRGAGLDGVTVDRRPRTDRAPAAARPTTAAIEISSLREQLEQRAAGPRARASDLLDLVEYYRWVRPFASEDRTAVELAHRANARAKTARSAWLVALLEPDQNDSRTALVEGIERARGERAQGLLASMLLELAWRHRSLGMERRARELLEQAQLAAPDDAIVELARVDQLADDGFPLGALAWIEDMLVRYPDSGALLRERAGRLAELGRTREAIGVLEQLSNGRHSDGSLLSHRIEAHLALGEVDQAVALARRAAAASPGLPGAHQQVARLEQARGDYPAAVAALGHAIDLAPQDAGLHAELGQLLSRRGDREGAVRAFTRSLDLKPQQPEIRDMLAALDPGGEGDLLRRHAVDLERVAGSFRAPASWRGKEAGILHHRVVVHVLPNGLSERLDHRIIRVLDERGIESQSLQAMSYDPNESYVEIRRARVRRTDGTIEESANQHVVSLAESGYRMYYDQRQARVKFQGLRVGDTLEVAFVRRDVAARNMFDEYFGDIMPLQGIEPRRRVEYVLEAPAAKPLYFNQDVTKTIAGDTATYRLVRENVAGIKAESSMPGWSEVADYLHVSTYKSWDEVGNWYWGLVSGQLLVNDEIRAGVRQALAGLGADADVRAKTEAIYRHVIRSTRYVGLEFGIHGYKPYRTTEVYDRRFGDCKDKASLLKVMLQEAGVDSHLVLVRTRDQGALGTRPASLAGFNHAIVYVPALDLFLDGTAEWSGPNELPAQDQGASVLVVEDGKGATFRRAPMSTAADNLQRVQQRVQIDAHGDATVEHTLALRGVAAANWRIRLQSPDERREELTKVVSSQYPRAQVLSASFPAIEDVLAPVRVQARLSIPGWARPEGKTLRFPVLGREAAVKNRLAAQVRREHDLVLTAPSREEYEIRYELPAGMRFSSVPAAKHITSDHGEFTLEVESDGRTATVRSHMQISADRLAPASYAEFRELLRQIDSSLAQSFEAVAEQ